MRNFFVMLTANGQPSVFLKKNGSCAPVPNAMIIEPNETYWSSTDLNEAHKKAKEVGGYAWSRPTPEERWEEARQRRLAKAGAKT